MWAHNAGPVAAGFLLLRGERGRELLDALLALRGRAALGGRGGGDLHSGTRHGRRAEARRHVAGRPAGEAPEIRGHAAAHGHEAERVGGHGAAVLVPLGRGAGGEVHAVAVGVVADGLAVRGREAGGLDQQRASLGVDLEGLGLGLGLGEVALGAAADRRGLGLVDRELAGLLGGPRRGHRRGAAAVHRVGGRAHDGIVHLYLRLDRGGGDGRAGGGLAREGGRDEERDEHGPSRADAPDCVPAGLKRRACKTSGITPKISHSQRSTIAKKSGFVKEIVPRALF